MSRKLGEANSHPHKQITWSGTLGRAVTLTVAASGVRSPRSACRTFADLQYEHKCNDFRLQYGTLENDIKESDRTDRKVLFLSRETS